MNIAYHFLLLLICISQFAYSQEIPIDSENDMKPKRLRGNRVRKKSTPDKNSFLPDSTPVHAMYREGSRSETLNMFRTKKKVSLGMEEGRESLIEKWRQISTGYEKHIDPVQEDLDAQIHQLGNNKTLYSI